MTGRCWQRFPGFSSGMVQRDDPLIESLMLHRISAHTEAPWPTLGHTAGPVLCILGVSFCFQSFHPFSHLELVLRHFYENSAREVMGLTYSQMRTLILDDSPTWPVASPSAQVSHLSSICCTLSFLCFPEDRATWQNAGSKWDLG